MLCLTILLLLQLLLHIAPLVKSASCGFEPGDVMIIGAVSDNPDYFAFVLLKNVVEGVTISFTNHDNDIWQWSAPSALQAGTVISTQGTAPLSLSLSGDFILAKGYLPVTEHYIGGFNFGHSWTPNGLTSKTAIVFSHKDNWRYSGPKSGTKSQIIDAIGNLNNWDSDNTEEYNLNNLGSFTVTDAICTVDILSPCGLYPGDIMIVGYTADSPDSFAFVALENIRANTQITFTNREISKNVLAASGQMYTWTAASDVISGTVIIPDEHNINFSTYGGNVLAFCGAEYENFFLTGFESDGGDMPVTLSPKTFISFIEKDNWKYNGKTTGRKEELIDAISSQTNWLYDNSNAYDLTTIPNFNVIGSTPLNPVVTTVSPSSSPISILSNVPSKSPSIEKSSVPSYLPSIAKSSVPSNSPSKAKSSIPSIARDDSTSAPANSSNDNVTTSPTNSIRDVSAFPSSKIPVDISSVAPSTEPPPSVERNRTVSSAPTSLTKILVAEAKFTIQMILEGVGTSDMPIDHSELKLVVETLCKSVTSMLTIYTFCDVLQIGDTTTRDIIATIIPRRRRKLFDDTLQVNYEFGLKLLCNEPSCVEGTSNLNNYVDDVKDQVISFVNDGSLVNSIVKNANKDNVTPLRQVTYINPSNVVSSDAQISVSTSTDAAPAKIIDDDGWYIELKGSSYDKNSTSMLEGLLLEYIISKGKLSSQLIATIYDESCEIPSADMSVHVNSTKVMQSFEPGYEIFDKGIVEIIFVADTIENSTFWKNISRGKSTINFCVKAELLTQTGGESVSFNEGKVISNVNLEAGFTNFEIEDIQLVKYNATEIEKETSYQIEACICDENRVCDEMPTLYQNGKFSICIIPSSDEVLVSEINQVILYQDDIAKFVAVNHAEPHEFASITSVGSTAVVDTRLFSTFFEKPEPSDLFITGEVLLALKSERALRERDLLDSRRVDSTASFDLKVGIARSSFLHLRKTRNIGIFVIGLLLISVTLTFRTNHHNNYKSVDSNEW